MAAPLFVAVSIILRTVAYRGKTKPPTEEGRGKRERGSFLAANNTRAGLLSLPPSAGQSPLGVS